MLAIALAAALALPAIGAAAVKRGTTGPDSLVGTARSDGLFGLPGSDALTGRAAADRLFGGPGADRLIGGAGPDRFSGGGGNDRLRARDGEVDTVDCGAGASDVATVDADDRVSPSCEKVVAPVAGPLPPQPTPPVAPRLDPPPPPEEKPGEEKPGEEEPGEEEPPVEEEPEPEFEEQPLAMFPFGHGWTGVNGAFTDAGPPFVVNGDRSFRIGSLGTGTTAVATSPPLAPVDLEHAHVSVQGLVSFSNRLETVKIRLASGDIATDYAEATVWQANFDPVILGSTFEFQSLARGDFAVTGQVDWSQIDRAQILVTDNTLGEVAFYVAGIYAVPDKARATVSFAFDDGDASTYTRALKKLSTYRFPATAYLIADTVGNSGFMTLEQLEKLRDLHHWEIAPHSLTIGAHNLPNGLDDLEPPAALKAEMNGLRDWIYENGFSRASFAYPKGAAGPEVRQYVKRDYCSGRVTARGPETVPPRDEYILRGWSINGLESDAADVEAAVDKAVADGTWAILSFHDIVGGAPDEATDFNDDEFEAVVDYVRTLQKEGKVRVRTVGDVVAPHCAD